MKTIYTDRFGFYPWALLALSIIFFRSGYQIIVGVRHAPFGIDGTVGGAVFVLVAGYWLVLAGKRILDVRLAKREGRDPAIVRVKD